jgi:hypothetical protein
LSFIRIVTTGTERKKTQNQVNQVYEVFFGGLSAGRSGSWTSPGVLKNAAFGGVGFTDFAVFFDFDFLPAAIE